MSTVIWTAVILSLILLGVFRPRWLATIVVVAFAMSVVGILFVTFLILIGKFMGGGERK